MPIKSFKDQGTCDIAEERATKAARKKLPAGLHAGAYRKLVFLDNAHALTDLTAWKSLRLEKLHADRKNQFSIRINDQYRICFRWSGADAFEVEVVDYH
jgi:proteic killer suppression protein